MVMDDAVIIDYTDEYAEHFRMLNLEWLGQYGLLESHDVMVINDPRGTILNKGGYIFLAKVGDTIAGSAALMNEGHGEYELAKMAVAPAYRGRGISKLLIESCIEKAKEVGAIKISLFSNHQLQTAIHLYEKYDFKHVEVKGSPFETADVKMELGLSPGPSPGDRENGKSKKSEMT
jgi:GNAT superfamily N-acetyltransferase